MKTNPSDYIKKATNGDLGKMLMEYARRHVGDEKETLLEAARRIKAVRQETVSESSQE